MFTRRATCSPDGFFMLSLFVSDTRTVHVQYTHSTRLHVQYVYVYSCTRRGLCSCVLCTRTRTVVHVRSLTTLWKYGNIFVLSKVSIFERNKVQRCTFKVRKVLSKVHVLYTCTTLYTYSYDTSVLPTFHNPKVSC